MFRREASSQSESQQRGRDSNDSQANARSSQSSSPRKFLPQVFGGLSRLLVWLYYAAFAVVALWLLYRYREQVRQFVRQLWADLQNLWRKLFGGGAAQETATAAAEAAKTRTYPPFSAFANPFAAGASPQRTAEQLVEYSFAALEAWARDHGSARPQEQTPLEFAQQLARAYPAVSRTVRDVCDLYCRLAYGDARLPQQSLLVLRQFWNTIATA
jgi:hypothetical protein